LPRPVLALRTIEEVASAEIARLGKEGPTAAELNRAKTKWEFSFISGLERIGGFGGKADRLNQYNTFLGDPGKFESDLDRYRKISAEDVRQTVNRWINTKNRLLVRFHPETSGREMQMALDRAEQPPLGRDRPFLVPEVKTATLENGLELLVVERKDLPKVAVDLVTKAGSIYDPVGKEGCARLMMGTIDLGTKSRKALEIEDALGDLGTSLGGSAGREELSLGFEVLKRNLAPSMSILADVIMHPTFPASEVERERKRRLDGLAQETNEPTAVAMRVGNMLAYGANHPYGRPELPGSVEKISQEDMIRFHGAYLKPKGSALILVGDISMEDAGSAIPGKLDGQFAGGIGDSSGAASTCQQSLPGGSPGCCPVGDCSISTRPAAPNQRLLCLDPG
jgi:zinc protease